MEAGHVLLGLGVTDEDSESYGGPPFNISIHGTGSEALEVDRNMNVVTTALLRETKGETLELTVSAEDCSHDEECQSMRRWFSDIRERWRRQKHRVLAESSREGGEHSSAQREF